MQISNNYENNTNFYKFTSRGTDYTIIIKDNEKHVEAWTKTRAWGSNVKTFNNLNEFANANKTFNNFAKLLAA